MFLQAMETATSFWGASLQYILWWLSTAALAYFVYRFWDGSKYKTQIEKKNATIQKLKPELDVLTNKQVHLASERDQLKNNLEELLNKHNSLKAYHDNVQSKYQASSKQFEQSNEERQSLLDSYESLEKNLDASNKRYNDALTKIDKLENELENIEDSGGQNGTLLKEIQRLEDIIIDKNKEVNQLQTSLASASVPSEGLNLVDNVEVSALEQKYTNSIAEKKKLQASFSALQTNYNKLRNDYTTVKNNVQALELNNKKFNEKVNSLEQNLVIAKKSSGGTSTASVKLVEQKLTDLQAKYVAKNKEVQQLEATYKELEAQNQAVSKTKSQVQNQYARIDKELSTLKSANENLKGRYELLSEQFQQAQNSSSTLQATILNLEKNQSEKKGSLSQIEQITKTLRTENEVLKKEAIELNLAKKNLNQQYLLVKKQLEAQPSKVKMVSSNSTEVKQLTLKLQQKGKELLNTQTQLKGLLETRAANLALGTNNKNLNTAYINLQKKYDGFYKDYLSIKSQFQFLKDKYEHLENTSANVSEQKQKLNKNNTQLALEISKLRNAQQTLLSEKIDYEKRLKEMEKYIAPTTTPKSSSRTTRIIRNGLAPKMADDLKIVEGIGSQVEELLNNNGIATWKKLSHTGIGELKRILAKNGDQYKMHNPSTWPEQAGLAYSNKWTELERLQKELINGVRR